MGVAPSGLAIDSSPPAPVVAPAAPEPSPVSESPEQAAGITNSDEQPKLTSNHARTDIDSA
jgi:hypothetical protein